MTDLHVLPTLTGPPVPSDGSTRRYVGLADAGQTTGLSKSYLHQQVMAGTLPAHRVGRRILINVDDLDRFIRRTPV